MGLLICDRNPLQRLRYKQLLIQDSSFTILDERTDDIGFAWYQIRSSGGVTPIAQTWVRSNLVSLVPPIAAASAMSYNGTIIHVETQLRAVPNVSINEGLPNWGERNCGR